MNNIFLPNDPLLFNQQLQDYRQLYELKLMHDREQLDKQYNEYMQNLNRNIPEDKLTQLNNSINTLSTKLKEKLLENLEFVTLNKELQDTVQNELVLLVKLNINSNQNMINNIDKLISIITELNNKTKAEDLKNMDELNDYIKNYSNMTFQEYKKLKNVTNEQN